MAAVSGRGIQITISNLTVSTIAASTAAAYRLESDGDIMTSNFTGSAVTVDSGDWIIPRGAAGGAYEVRVTVTSGTLTSGTTGSWLALSTNREWSVINNISGTISTVIMTVEIRSTSSGTVLGSATITLTAECP